MLEVAPRGDAGGAGRLGDLAGGGGAGAAEVVGDATHGLAAHPLGQWRGAVSWSLEWYVRSPEGEHAGTLMRAQLADYPG